MAGLPSLDDIRALLRARREAPVSLAERRAGMDAFGLQAPLPEGVSATSIELAPGLRAERIGSAATQAGRTILHIHGGAYVAGSPRSHRPLGVRLHQQTGAEVLLLDYRLAPEHPFPAAIDDVDKALGLLLADPAARLVLTGDSAGGGAALAAVQRRRDRGDRLPQGLALVSPWLDLTLSGPSHAGRAADDPFLTTAGLARDAATYLAGADAADPRASPLLGSHHGLPPTLVQVGDAEILLDDARRFAERARLAESAVTLTVWQDMFHVWHAFAGLIPQADSATQDLARFALDILERAETTTGQP